MASIGQLIRVVAHVSGLEEASVKLIARYLREAGMIAQQSTGAGAARMTPNDAVALLIAVNTAPLAKNAVEYVKTYYNLLGWSQEPNTKDATLLGLARELSALEKFGDILAKLIEFYIPVPSGFSILLHEPSEAPVSVRVYFERPVPVAGLAIWESGASWMEPGPQISSFTFRTEVGDEIYRGSGLDRRVEITITHATIHAVAEVLAN